MSELDKIKEQLRAVKKMEIPNWDKGISSGCTLLNLACSGRPDIGYIPGHYYFLVGDSASGKTWNLLSTLCEASISPLYKNHQLIFDDVEQGALMDLGKFFPPLVDRLKSPIAGCSQTVEGFYYNVDVAMDSGPCVYVLDSMDALTTEDELSKFAERKKAYQKGKETSGTYGTSKAKLNSAYLRVIHNRLRETGSILLVVSQTRDNIGFGSQFQPKTRGGGRALTFYAALELWTSVYSSIKRTVMGKPRELGIICQVRVKKNRLTGRDRTIRFPLYHSHGIDDTGACVDWLIEEGHWEEKEGRIKPPEFDFEGRSEKLIKLIEEQNKEEELRELVADIWGKIEKAAEVGRKNRYPSNKKG